VNVRLGTAVAGPYRMFHFVTNALAVEVKAENFRAAPESITSWGLGGIAAGAVIPSDTPGGPAAEALRVHRRNGRDHGGQRGVYVRDPHGAYDGAAFVAGDIGVFAVLANDHPTAAIDAERLVGNDRKLLLTAQAFTQP
jgi:hypothetical protein